MKKKRILINSIISTLLLTSTLSAQSMTCKNGKCFIDISKLSPSKSIESKISTFKNLQKPYFVTEMQEDIACSSVDNINTIILEHSKYVMSEDEKNNYLFNNNVLYNAEDTIVLIDTKYVMTDIEKEEYYISERIKRAELEKGLMLPIITFEDRAVNEEVILPHSEFYCDSSKQARFHPDTNYYECA